MATTGSDDNDDALGSFNDDGFGSFEDGDPTGAATAVPDADQPTHDVTETAETANNNPESEVDGGSLLPPPDIATDFPADVDAGILPDSPVTEDTAEDTAGGDESAATASEESPAPSNDISPEAEQESQESDAPLALPSPSPSPSPSPPEIPSAEEAMETADETASAPEAFTAPLPDLASPDAAADATTGMDGAGSAAPAMMTMTSPPPINIGEISTDSPDDDPFASLGGAADAPLPVLSGSADAGEGGFGSLGGFGDMSGGDGAAAPSSANADVDADAGLDTSIPKAESGTEENKVEATSMDVPTLDPGKVETLPDPVDGGGVDLLGAFPSEKEEETSEVEVTDMNDNVTDPDSADATAVDAISTEPPSPTSNANPSLDQLSSFVTAVTEEEEVAGTEDGAPSTEDQDDGEDIGNDGNNDDEDEDDFGGFEDAASEEEEKKDGSPIADKAISDTVNSTNAIPPALPLETSKDDAPAETLAPATDSFGAFGDGASDGAVADDDNGSDKEMDIPKAESTDEHGDYEETTDSAAAAFGAFRDISSSAAEPTPISDDLPAEAKAVQVQVMDVGAAGTEAISPVDTKDDTHASEMEAVDTGNRIVTETVERPASDPDNAVSNGFDAFAEVSAPSHVDAEMSMEPVETNNKSTEEDTDDEDDGFEAFAEAPAVAEENEEPTGFVGEVSPSNNDVLANDMPESPDEHIPEPVESTEDDFDAFEEAPVAIAATEGSDLVATSEDGNDDGFDAFAEAPAPSPSPERAYKMDASDAPAPAPAPAQDSDDDDNDDDEFGDFDAFSEAPASSAPPNDTHQVDEFDAPAPVPVPVATMEASEPGEEKAEEDAEVEQQQEKQNGDDDDDESDDDFGDFGDFGGISEAGEIPASEEVNGADMAVESETPQQEAAAPAAAAAPEKDSDDEDDDFGDFGDFDEAPAPEPAAATDAIPAPTAPNAEPIPVDQGFAASFEEQAATPIGHSTPAESDPIIQKATVVCKGIFQQYASSPLEEGGEENKEIASIPVKSILDSILAGEDFGPTAEPSSTLSSKEKMKNIFSETQIERGPAKLIMNYNMPKPYAQYGADSGADLKTDRGLSLEASSHSNDGDVFVPDVLSIDLPKESELSPEPRMPKSQVEPSAEFVDFPMSATRVVIPDKKEVSADEDGFANFGDSAAPAEPATPTVAEPESAVDKFLAKIPDLSFMLSKELVLPK